jgi:glycosyltransferase involved in cell wall biosynthesis
MGKKSKNPKPEKPEPTVSIVTINQLKRAETIKICLEHVNNQTYKNIIEWVITEGSSNLEDCLENEKNIPFLKEHCKIPIVYVPGYTLDDSGNKIFNNNKLGALRNLGNTTCTGDITVVFDDDDQYPPTRVSHAVEMLMGSKCLIAGCSGKYLYDYQLEKMYLFKPFGPNHSTNDCMAWKKEYLLENSHDPTKELAEESSLTKNFANSLVQLDPKHVIVSSSHYMNTFSKKEICIFASIGIYPNATEVPLTESIFPKKYLDRYKALYTKPGESDYDIIYFTGGTSIEWDPNDQSLGGSEQAVVNLSMEWVHLGKKVAVYGKLKTVGTFGGVEYIDWKTFDYDKRYKTVILWRMAGINCMLQFPIKAERLYADLHDNNHQYRFDYPKYAHKLDKIFFKSEYHVQTYETALGKLENSKVVIIPNGIRVEQFNKEPSDIKRNPYRFCYCSCYTRGLTEILAFIWPVIFKYEPRAELHVYYGMHHIQDPNYKQQLTMLLAQPGVMDHGRQPMELIIREKWQSTYHLYVTDTDREIDCISIRESLVSGCIPLVSDFGVFAKREGLRFKLDRANNQSYLQIAQGILNLLPKQDFIYMCRNKFKESPTITTWKQTAEQWLAI